MTTPAIIESAPVTEFASAEDGIAAIAREAITQTLAENPEPVDDAPVRDEKGRFIAAPAAPVAGVAAEAVPAVADAQAPPAEVVLEAPAPPPVLPEGFVAVPKIEGRALETAFSVLDQEGELEVPDLQIKFTANGKERTESLDKVVRLAQWGVYNKEREESVLAAKATHQQATARVQEVEAFARQLLAEREQMLTSDEVYLTTRAQYEAQHTPEARMQQQQQQLIQERQQVEFNQASMQGEQFFTGELAPTVEAIHKALPTVSLEEIAARLLLVSNQYEVHTPFGSILPPKHYDAIRAAIMQEIVPWAQQAHDSRETERKTTTSKTDAEKLALQQAADQARIDAQKARSLVGRSARPGTQGRPGSTAPPPKPIKTVQDAEDAALADTLAAMR